MWEKEKLLVTSNFSFSHSVFNRPVLQTRENQGLFGKGLNHILSYFDIQKCLRFSMVCEYNSNIDLYLYPLQNQCSWGYTGISLSVCQCVHVSVGVSGCVQNTSFCHCPGRGIKLLSAGSRATRCVRALLF